MFGAHTWFEAYFCAESKSVLVFSLRWIPSLLKFHTHMRFFKCNRIFMQIVPFYLSWKELMIINTYSIIIDHFKLVNKGWESGKMRENPSKNALFVVSWVFPASYFYKLWAFEFDVSWSITILNHKTNPFSTANMIFLLKLGTFKASGGH